MREGAAHRPSTHKTTQAHNRTFGPFPDLPADFGPTLASSLTARVVRADPPDACASTIAPPPSTPRGPGPPAPWIAVIARSKRTGPGCSFGVKIRAAAAAGAAGAIVFDSESDPLVAMADDGGRRKRRGGDEDRLIPSVFVSSRAGRALVAAAAADGVASISPPAGSLLASILVSALAGVLAVAAVVAVLHVVVERAVRAGVGGGGGGYVPLAGGGGTPPLTPAQLRALPVIVFGGDTADATKSSSLTPPAPPPRAWSSDAGCTICLDAFLPGDALRELPRCGHRFHVACVDEWLSARARSCPLCKADAAPAEEGGDVESGARPARRFWRWRRESGGA